MTEKDKSGVRLLIAAGIAGVVGLAMLLSLLPEERREEMVRSWEEDRQWHTRPARVVEIDCTREAVNDRNPCTDDGRFEIRYQYRYGDRDFEGTRIAPESMLRRFDPEVHEQLRERYAHAKLHSRPFTIHLNQDDPEDAYIFPPEKVWGPTFSLIGGIILLLVSAVTLRMGVRRF